MKPFAKRMLAWAALLVGVLISIFFALSLVGMVAQGTLNLWVALVTLAGLWLGCKLVGKGRHLLRLPTALPESHATAADQQPIACPTCGAVDLPYEDGSCSYCGRKIG